MPIRSVMMAEKCSALSTYAYCVFCATGQEETTSALLSLLTGAVAFSPRLTCHICQEKHWIDREYLLLPGYVFLFSRQKLPVASILHTPEVISILHYGDHQYELKGQDAEFAQFFYQYGGTIGKSKAVRDGMHIRVLEGPLKHLCDHICAVNKQRRRAKVMLRFNGHARFVWLAFDWLDKV